MVSEPSDAARLKVVCVIVYWTLYVWIICIFAPRLASSFSFPLWLDEVLPAYVFFLSFLFPSVLLPHEKGYV